MTHSTPMQAALRLPQGARFVKCALQVNPYGYLLRHSRPTTFQDEGSYNAAIVGACRDHGIELIAVTDHYRVRSSDSLTRAAQEAGIMHPRLRNARELVESDGVRPRGDGGFFVRGTGVEHSVALTESGGACTCRWYAKHQGVRGPCKHVLAARIHAGDDA